MPAPERIAEELRLLVRRAQAERVPSVSAAVVRRGEVAWAESVGLADAETGREATPDTQYRIGSITKTFTAAAVMQLRDEGKLALDDPIGEHVNGLAHGEATIRRLLAHLSGLQREPVGEIWETLELPDREEFLSRVGEAERALAPGLAWHYSNLAYGLLGELVERVAARPYARVVEERLFRPLGLARTTWQPVEPAARGYLVDAYAERVRSEPPVDLRGIAAMGGLWSTTGDLCRWAAFLAEPDPAVLARSTLDEMCAVHTMRDERGWRVGWGLGLALFRDGDRILAGHGGAMPGHLACVAVAREEGVGAAVLTNTGAGCDVQELALRLAVRTIELWPPEPEPWRPEPPPPAEVEGVLGRWWSEGEEYVFRWRRGRLEVFPVDLPDRVSVFEPEGPDAFRTVAGPERGELLRVVRDGAGEVVKLYWATYPFTREQKPFGS